MHRTDSADGSAHLYAKLAQACARTAYACFDQPDLKSPFTFRVTAPAGWVVLSNQPQAYVERTLDDSQTVRFLPTPALPTFTTTAVAGDYHLVTAEHTTPGGQRIPLEPDDVGPGADRRVRRRPAAVVAPGGVGRGDGQRGDRDVRRDQLREGRRRPGGRPNDSAVAARRAPARPDPAQRRRHRLRHRPVRSAVPGHGAVIGRRPADPGLARIIRDHRDTAERVLRARTSAPRTSIRSDSQESFS